ncbi:DMT family transporter [Aliiroseovarius sediminis]|uniref:DMT family transporter n=1 Tax=Aliiroseovarius sediminis TaxID=2925839 RepID=UPI001F5972E2|nr:DMT family transporter [Aliiroseovarius sediminis]MCI2393475.1 DMT family transporter [Aliiroseovarius sediminis]
MNPSRGIALKLGSVAFFLSLQTMVKAVSGHVPAGEAVFFRSLFALPVIFGWLAYEGRLHSALRTTNPWGHVSRGTVGVLAMTLSFSALGYLPLPEVTAIFYAAPIITVILAAIILGERVRMVRIGAVLAGLVGVLVILWPRLDGFSGEGDDALRAFGALLALIAACCMAVAKILVRKLVGIDPPSTVVIYASLTAICLSLLSLPFGWVWPTGNEFALLLGAGLAGGVGQLMLTTAYTHADASTIAPFDYSSMIFALIFGYIFFAELPTLQMLAGAGIVVFAGMVIIWREAQLGRDLSKSRAVSPPGG